MLQMIRAGVDRHSIGRCLATIGSSWAGHPDIAVSWGYSMSSGIGMDIFTDVIVLFEIVIITTKISIVLPDITIISRKFPAGASGFGGSASVGLQDFGVSRAPLSAFRCPVYMRRSL